MKRLALALAVALAACSTSSPTDALVDLRRSVECDSACTETGSIELEIIVITVER